MNLNTDVIVTITRNPLIWKVLLPWLLSFLTLFLIFQHFLIRSINKKFIKKEDNWIKDFLISVTALIFMILMIDFAVHYGPINLLKPISNWFNIPYN